MNLTACSMGRHLVVTAVVCAEQVQATVNFSIKPGGAQAPGPFPMTAQPAQLVIPANESRFMAVHFAPTAIRSYSAAFEAVVEAGADAATGRFTCELRGEGTLPSLTLELPQADKGPPALRFPRLLMVSSPVALPLPVVCGPNKLILRSFCSSLRLYVCLPM